MGQNNGRSKVPKTPKRASLLKHALEHGSQSSLTIDIGSVNTVYSTQMQILISP